MRAFTVANYDRFPRSETGLHLTALTAGWDAIAARLLEGLQTSSFVVVIECYPGVEENIVADVLKSRLELKQVLRTSQAMLPAVTIEQKFASDLTSDPVFGVRSRARIQDFFSPDDVAAIRMHLEASSGRTLVIGPGAALFVDAADLLIYADLPRWEIQGRQRRNKVGNLGLSNCSERASLKYKRAFFLDWPVADKVKLDVLPRADFVLDTTVTEAPKLLSGVDYRAALAAVARKPFRVVPFFDPGPWGGHWMKETFGLPEGNPNYAWCFDCVPEENSLFLGVGSHVFETPAQNIVMLQPRALLGEAVHARFGLEFPIRFDMLDTVGGGNLSLQVHPLTEYIREHFGMSYTQDESYYMLDAECGATVWLGVLPEVDPIAVANDLHRAAEGLEAFRPELYFNRFAVAKHDHFLIPAGTPHCSGAGSMVLEISATPFIFTFKMWDWNRLGLDGRPRPTHINHALRNLQWDRDLTWVTRELINVVTPIAKGGDWREESTGLHAGEFIETRRHWFTGRVEHSSHGGVNVLNLVEGRTALIESPTGAFDSYELHYAETVIVPACVGVYTIRPQTGSTGPHATIKASVRTGPASLRVI